LTPGQGRAGDAILLEGSDLHDGLQVLFAGVPAVVLDSTPVSGNLRLTVVVPDLPTGLTPVRVRNRDGGASPEKSFTVLPPEALFVRGDFNLDGTIDISDGVRLLLHLFLGAPADCLDAGDVDNNEKLNLTDAARILDFLFRGGPAPAPPVQTPGVDEGEGPLDCSRGSSGP
jgi:hypothetical protein